MTPKKTYAAIFLLFCLGFIWGSGYTLAKYAMTNGVPPLGYAFWQALGPAILLTTLSFFNKSVTFSSYKQNIPFFLISGLLGIAIPNTNMYFIASYIPAGLLAVLVNTVPLIVYPLALASKQEQFDKWRFLAVILGLIGIYFIISPQINSHLTPWFSLVLISPLCFALCSIFIAVKQPSSLNNYQAASGMLITASVLLLPLVLQQQAFYPLTYPFSTASWVVIAEIFLSSLGYLLYFQLIRLAGPVFYSLTGAVVALTGLFWGYAIFAEIPHIKQGLAAFCIITAILVLSWRQSLIKEESYV